MRTRILLLLACCALVMSCNKDGGGSGKKGTTKTYGTLSHLSITDAQYLYATSGAEIGGRARSATRSGGGESSQLFKIKYNGQTEEISIQDENGETIPVENMKIAPANDDLVFFAFEYGIYETDSDGNIIYITDYHGDRIKSQVGNVSQAYLIRKNDGAVFVVPEAFYAAFGWYSSSWSDIENPTVGTDKLAHLLMRYDKNNNMYCLSNSNVYKVVSTSGVVATKVVSNTDDYCVDWNGNILYGGSDTWCVTPAGRSFKVGNVPINRNLNFILPFHKSSTGGFLYWEWSEGAIWLYKYAVNETTESADKELLATIPFSTHPLYDLQRTSGYEAYRNTLIILKDKTVFNDRNRIIIIKGPDDIKTVNATINQIVHISDNYIYYINNGIQSMNIATEATATVFSFAANRDYSGYSFADDSILFYATDKQSGDIYLCQIKGGTYSDKLIASGTNNNTDSAPEIIDFLRIN